MRVCDKGLCFSRIDELHSQSGQRQQKPGADGCFNSPENNRGSDYDTLRSSQAGEISC
jgi:hypothetical protein